MRKWQLITIGCGFSFVIFMATVLPATAKPTLFWVSEPINPGEVVLLYGGDLQNVRDVSVWQLVDDDPGSPPRQSSESTVRSPQSRIQSAEAIRVPTLQPSDNSLKFLLPKEQALGIFVVDFGGEPKLINVPRPEWCQPTRLLPGLNENEAAPGSTVQIIGRNFLLEETGASKTKVALRGHGGNLVWPKVTQVEKYSLLVTLPEDLPLGEYEVWVHNGHGGSSAWGSGLRLTIKQATQWPQTVFNVEGFGAKGDNITDDSEAFHHALKAAEKNGGGVVYFPYGIYRLTGWFYLPKRVVLRGEGKDITWLKWPQTNPQLAADFIPAVLYGTGEYGLEDLSIMVRNAHIVLLDLSYVAAQREMYGPTWGGNVMDPGMEPYIPPPNSTRDIFLRRLQLHYLPFVGRPSGNPTADPQWQFFRWGITNSNGVVDLSVAMTGVKNVEVSDCTFVGSQRFLDLQNARFVGNHFSSPMEASWTDLGGQHVVFKGNRIIGQASSWRCTLLPVRWLYVAHNYSWNVVRGEREALTFDVNGVLGERRKSHAVPVWQGKVVSATATTVSLQGATFEPETYRDFDVQILSGKGAGQYRTIVSNTADTLTVATPWDVPPDDTSIVLVHRLFGHVIFYGNVAEDTSVLGQIWGHLYDVVFDGNEVRRSQGMWGLAGWFVQWLNNRLDVTVTYHARIGPAGRTPEGNAEYGYIGFTISGRVTSSEIPVEYVRGAVIRSNRLSYGHRVLVMWGYGGERKRVNFVVARDIVIDHNQIDHTPIGIELDANVEGVVVAHNTFTDVREPLRIHDPKRVLVLDAP